VRDGSEHNPTKYTLEVILYNFIFIQKISIEDIADIKTYVHQLTKKISLVKESKFQILSKKDKGDMKMAREAKNKKKGR